MSVYAISIKEEDQKALAFILSCTCNRIILHTLQARVLYITFVITAAVLLHGKLLSKELYFY